jgi:hypothetical protein
MKESRMSRTVRSSILTTGIVSIVSLVALVAGSLAIAQNAQNPSEVSPDAAAQMQACIEAGTPGKQHQRLAALVGVWRGRTQMYFGPGSEPARGSCTWTATSIYGGRYIKAELNAAIPGFAGAFEGVGYAGFDNVSQKFVSTWLDSHSTGIMNGVGELTESGGRATFTWTYVTNCPVTRKPSTVREVQTITGDNAMTFEMFTPDPATGEEFKCMHIDFTRQS